MIDGPWCFVGDRRSLVLAIRVKSLAKGLYFPNRDSNPVPPDCESGALPLYHGETTSNGIIYLSVV